MLNFVAVVIGISIAYAGQSRNCSEFLWKLSKGGAYVHARVARTSACRRSAIGLLVTRFSAGLGSSGVTLPRYLSVPPHRLGV